MSITTYHFASVAFEDEPTVLRSTDSEPLLWLTGEPGSYMLNDENTAIPVGNDDDLDEIVRQWVISVYGYAMNDAYAGATIASCAYCDSGPFVEPSVPDMDDDTAWEELAAEHADDCEWIVTRANRR